MPKKSTRQERFTIRGFEITYFPYDEVYEIVNEELDIDITIDYDTIVQLGLVLHDLDDDATRRALGG